MRVLLVEDAVQPARDIMRVLRERGHEVTWMTGVNSIEDGVIVPNKECGVALVVCRQECQTEPMSSADFDCALLDGTSDGSLLGWDIAALLAPSIRCIGISSSREQNERMAAIASAPALLKAEVCTSMVSGTLASIF